ncbi:MAG: hypothetical protein C0443_05190 [Comamonadaceae bacterium]|nr:hypothetical protein [Comamonadaceae bacterium]
MLTERVGSCGRTLRRWSDDTWLARARRSTSMASGSGDTAGKVGCAMRCRKCVMCWQNMVLRSKPSGTWSTTLGGAPTRSSQTVPFT